MGPAISGVKVGQIEDSFSESLRITMVGRGSDGKLKRGYAFSTVHFYVGIGSTSPIGAVGSVFRRVVVPSPSIRVAVYIFTLVPRPAGAFPQAAAGKEDDSSRTVEVGDLEARVIVSCYVGI